MFTVILIFQVFDDCTVDYMHESVNYTLFLHDTAGSEDYDRLRPLGYSNAHVFLMCYSVVSRDAFKNVTEKVRDRKVSMTVAL